jgi:hypothetical protein
MSTHRPGPHPHQALYRRWRAQTFGPDRRPGRPSSRRCATPSGWTAEPRPALRRAARHGQDLDGAHRRQGGQLPGPVDGEPDDTASRAPPSARAGRSTWSSWTPPRTTASTTCASCCRASTPAPSDLRRKVFIIDEVQRIKEGWDVLLKTLEEPPDDVLFIFCTTDPSGIRPAVVSRLQRFTFRPLPSREIEAKLRRILEAEGRTVSDEAIALIAERAAGGMRDAESMLDQVLAGGAESDRCRCRARPARAGRAGDGRSIRRRPGRRRCRSTACACSTTWSATGATSSPSPTSWSMRLRERLVAALGEGERRRCRALAALTPGPRAGWPSRHQPRRRRRLSPAARAGPARAGAARRHVLRRPAGPGRRHVRAAGALPWATTPAPPDPAPGQ